MYYQNGIQSKSFVAKNDFPKFKESHQIIYINPIQLVFKREINLLKIDSSNEN